MKIKAAVVHEPNTPYVFEEIELAPPKADEILVKVAASGICHTDHAVVTTELNFAPFPIVLGHEGSGTVVEVGNIVKEFKPGDRIGMSFSYCGQCQTCASGRPYGCDKILDLNFKGRSYDGTTRLSKDGKSISCFFNQSSFATYCVTNQNNAVLLPDGIDFALAAPIGCGIQTGAGAVLNYLNPSPLSSIVVSGCGSVGLSGVMAAKLCGCERIIGVDVVESRLELASVLGATHVINAKHQDPVSAVLEITKGRGAEYALDATGIGACVRTSLNCTANFGVCAVVGNSQEITFNIAVELNPLQRTLVGILEGHCSPKKFIPQLIELYKKGLFPIDRLVKTYDFDELNTASHDALTGASVKSVVVMKD